MAATAECVKVIVRCRPMNEREDKLKCKASVSMESNRGQCSLQNPHDAKAPPKMFTFDGAYFTESTTEQIYNDIAYPLVEGVTEGYNGTIFAYGQTGCGKSFSMQGITNPSSQRGIIPRAFDHIFETVSVCEKTRFLIHASYCEIYNEEIRDLLGKDIKAKLDLHEHPEKGIYIDGISMHPVHNVNECERIMDRGWKNRATGSTLMNADSSRSHSIFTINLEMEVFDDEGEEHIRAGKLNLVDLAGSERQSKTGSTGARLKEATKINLSLSALGNVISALVDGKSKHIPYRDSKLTRLLQDSLGGNTKTLMVACISPADNNYDETLSTLRYANRAKNIQNKPKINEDPKDALLREYQAEIEKLKAMLMGQLPIPEGGFADLQVAAYNQQTARASSRSPHLAREELEKEKERIRQEYDEKIEEMRAQYEQEKGTKVKLEQDITKLRAFYDKQISNVDGQLAHLPPSAAVLGEIDWDEARTTEEIEGQGGHSSTRPDQAAGQGGRSSAGPKSGPKSGPSSAGSGVGRAVSRTKVVTEKETGEADYEFDEEGRPESVMGGESQLEGPGYGKDVLQIASVSDFNDDEDGESLQSSGRGVNMAGPNQEGIVAPSSSPTQDKMQEQLKRQQEEALRRLQELEKDMVGGENVNNQEVKERRKKRKTFAEERKRKLAEAIANMDDDGIMIGIYEDIHGELRAKNKILEKEKQMVESLQTEISDIQSEFQFERIDYLDQLRQQDKQLKFLQDLVDRIQPCIRKDCNYSNLDKIRREAKWDEEESKWILPKLAVERTSLPVSGTVMPGARGAGSEHRNRSPLANGEINAGGYDSEEDRYKEKLMRRHDGSNRYFQKKRTSHLLQASEPINKINMSEIKDSYGMTNQYPMTNGYSSSHTDEPVSKDLRAAQVHGQMLNEDAVLRRPMRLEALPTVGSQGGRKSKKKRGGLEPF